MGKHDALETTRLLLTLPKELIKEVDEADFKDAMSRQDKIRKLIVLGLEKKKEA